MKFIKRNIRYVWIFVVFLFIGSILAFNFSNVRFSAYAAEFSFNTEDKVYCNATIEDEFAEDRVVVVVKQKSGTTIFTVQDFAEIDAVAVENLSYPQEDASILSAEQEGEKIILSLTLHNPGKRNVLNAIKLLEKRKDVISAEPDYILSPCVMPNDAIFKSKGQWGLTGANGINAQNAWNITTGSEKVLVGVIDSGIDAGHEDLTNRVNEFYSRDFSGSSGGAFSDTFAHGTHVAGIIGAEGNNYIGVTGVNWNVQLVSLKIINEEEEKENKGDDAKRDEMFNSRLIKSVEYATSTGIPILNNSNGVSDYTGESNALETALGRYPGLFVTSAGNEEENNDTNPKRFPSNIRLPNVICVGAITSSGERADFSNYGQNTVDIYAPGAEILSTLPMAFRGFGYSMVQPGYGYMNGTSMAAPHVSGVAALMLSVDSSMTGAELKNAILNSTDNIEIETPSGIQSVKKLNAYRAVQKAIEHNSSKVDELFAKGKGTSSDPYLIYSEQDFRNIGYAVKLVYSSYTGYEWQIADCYRLMMDIVIQGNWIPFAYNFRGVFDGNGHKITYNTNISSGTLDKNYYGLFSSARGTIKNLTLENCNITLGAQKTKLTSNGYVYVGILAGSVYEGTVENVNVINSKIFCNTSSEAVVGGLAGTTNYAACSNCVVTGGNFSNCLGFVGGMAGSGELSNFKGGSCQATVTKYAYKSGDDIGKICGNTGDATGSVNANVTLKKNKNCIAEGTLITLADGRQVPVENLTGNESLLVWNLYTGTFDTAPILFIDKDATATYRVINLAFSDGTELKVISEHGLWDYNLNRYVYLDEDAAQYIGHWFNKQTTDGNITTSTRVQLTGVTISMEETAAYSPVTYGHLCYYVNGMLSMPGGIDGLFNIFEVDAETMRYDAAAMERDIAQYGLFTYEEFTQIVNVPQEVYDAFNAQYFKVAIGKGIVTEERLKELADRYARQLGMD